MTTLACGREVNPYTFNLAAHLAGCAKCMRAQRSD